MKVKQTALCLVSLLFVALLCVAPTAYATENALTSAKAACVVDVTSGRVLYCKNADERLSMASTTKIATALTVLNNAADIDEVVTVDKQACGIEGSSVYLTEGERLTVRDLLYGLMLRSGNDCAVQLALTVGGSVPRFVEMMNELALSLGCTNTHFVTPHGLHDEQHYTTAHELATITCEALRNQTFAEIVAAKTYRVATDNSTRVFVNKNKLLNNYAFADGVKTGYTKKAGRCFVGSATKDGMQTVCVLLNCGPMFEDCQTLLAKSFEEYKPITAVNKFQVMGSLGEGRNRSFYVSPCKFAYPLRDGEQMRVEVTLNNAKQTATVYVDDKIVGEVQLVKG